MIAEPYENMPAAVVGLKAGDILMEIDGKDLAGKNNQEVSADASRAGRHELQTEGATSRNGDSRWSSILYAVLSSYLSFLIIQCWITTSVIST